MGKIGKCCCWCEYEDCPRICVGKNPCETRLVINGNHPADLIYPINYSNEGAFDGLFPDGCGLVGESGPDRSLSTGHTQLKTWTAGIRYWDSIDVTSYICCGGPPFTEYPSGRGVGSGVHVTGTCSRVDLRYEDLRVLLRRDKQFVDGEWICTVRVDVCLKYKRYVVTNWKTCYFESIQSTFYALPFECGIIPTPPGTYTGQCGYCQDSLNNQSVYSQPADITQAPYPVAPGCDPLTDAQWDTDPNVQEFCLWRSKHFALPSIACGPISVTLTQADNKPNSQFTCCEGLDQPPVLMYEPAPDPQANACPAITFEDCPRTVPATTQYGRWGLFNPFGALPKNVPPYCSGDEVYIVNCIRSVEASRNQGWARTGGWTGDPKLLAEIEDTWTLHLDCLP